MKVKCKKYMLSYSDLWLIIWIIIDELFRDGMHCDCDKENVSLTCPSHLSPWTLRYLSRRECGEGSSVEPASRRVIMVRFGI